MKTIDEIRYDNLLRLVEQSGGLSNLVAQTNGRLSRPTLDQILKKRTTAAGTVKCIGDDLARKMEELLKLERGWMDNSQVSPPASTPGIVPDDLVRLLTIFSRSDALGRQAILAVADAIAGTTKLAG